MKKLKFLIAPLAGLALVGFTLTAFAVNQDTETTISGTALCAKCALHTADKCETVVRTVVNGKEVIYHLTGPEAEAFHKNICTQTDGEKVIVTGTVTEKDGQPMLAATKIEEVK